MSGGVWDGHTLAIFPGALADSGAGLTGMPGYQSIPEPQTQAGASGQQPCTEQLARQQNRQAEERRGSGGLQCHYLSCFLGRVLLQNLGLAAGEERGLEVQASRKQEKEH